jgi:hypothetical protein
MLSMADKLGARCKIDIMTVDSSAFLAGRRWRSRSESALCARLGAQLPETAVYAVLRSWQGARLKAD